MNNYYSYNRRKQYKGQKRRLTLNIIIIVAIILVMIGMSVILGNHLKNKLENAEINKEPIETSTIDTSSSSSNVIGEDGKMFFKNERTFEELKVLEGYLDLDKCDNTKDAESYVEYLKNVGYGGVLFSVTDESGKIAYDSFAVSELIGAHIKEGSASSDTVKVSIQKARSLGMKCTALADISCVCSSENNSYVQSEILKTVVVELGEWGFNEFIFQNGPSVSDFTSERADELFEFISVIRENLPDADIGLVIDAAILDNPEITPITELVFKFCDFFALDFSGELSGDEIKNYLENYSGSVTAYNIRFLSGADTCDGISAEYSIYSSLSTTNISFIKPVKYSEKLDDDGKFVFSSKMPEYTVEKGLIKKEDGKNDE